MLDRSHTQESRRFVDTFAASGYFDVTRWLDRDDEIEPLACDAARVPVADITRLFAEERWDVAGLRRALAVEALPVVWKDYFEQLLRRG